MKTTRQRDAQASRNLPARALRVTKRELERAVSSRFLRRHVKRSLWSVWKPVLKGSRQSMVAGYVKPAIAGSTDSTPGSRDDLAIPAWLRRSTGDQKPLNRPTRSIAAPPRLQKPKEGLALKAASAAERAKIDEAVARACALAEHGKVKK